jgi:hypothetical protein
MCIEPLPQAGGGGTYCCAMSISNKSSYVPALKTLICRNLCFRIFLVFYCLPVMLLPVSNGHGSSSRKTASDALSAFKEICWYDEKVALVVFLLYIPTAILK